MHCSPEVRRVIEAVYIAHAERVRGWLRRTWPSAREVLVEEAVAQVFADLCARPEGLLEVQQKGTGGVLPFLCCVARRQLRGMLRRSVNRLESLEVSSEDTPPFNEANRLNARIELRAYVPLVERAAEIHGPHHRHALEEALWECFGGEFEAQAARRFGVRREYISRARRWLADALDNP